MRGRAHFRSFTVIYLFSLFPRKMLKNVKEKLANIQFVKILPKRCFFFLPFEPFEFNSGAALVKYNVIVSIPKTKTKE